jgi:nifR3 family TIM-barrel protein
MVKATPGVPGVNMEPLDIGGLNIEMPVALAPMAGYTNAAFRTICHQFGCGFFFTEVINAAGITHGSKRTLFMLETLAGETPLAGHMYGSDPAVMADAARTIEDTGRFQLVDINCGCPVRKIVAKHCGVALMADPARLGRIVASVKKAVSLPVTVKTRLGLSEDSHNVLEVVKAVEESGGDAIHIHSRYASKQHSGPADWDALAEVKAACSIPVVGNGGIDGAEDAPRMLKHTGVDGVMIGRASIGNPWVFKDVATLLGGGEAEGRHSVQEHRRTIQAHVEAVVKLKEREQHFRKRGRMNSDEAAAVLFRPVLLKYMAGFRGSSSIRRGLNSMLSTAEIMAAVDRVLSAHESDWVDHA